jgi:hypothetical protein
MKMFLFTFVFTLSFNIFAKKPETDLILAQTLWNDFRNCESQVKNELKLINCVEGLISPNISRYEKGKLTSYLVMGFSFSNLFECGEVKNLLPINPKKNKKYFCMNVLGNTSKLPGFISVTIQRNRFTLDAIKYNDKS